MSPTIKRMAKARRVAQNVIGGLVGLVALSVVAGILVAATLTPALAVSGAAVTRGIGIFDSLPTYLQVDRPMEPSTMYYIDGNGNEVEMASWYDQNRVPLEFSEISPYVYDGLVSSEDKSYFEHGGVDISGLVRAVVTRHGGASTISQQYVKNVLMQQCEQEVPWTQGDGEEGIEEMDAAMAECWRDAVESEGIDGYKRKLQELRFAMQIEKDYSKNDIIQGYLNLVNFGGTVRGIGAASEYYFSKPAKDLSLAEAATLVGMVQNPNGYRIDSPTDNDGKEIPTYLENARAGIWVNSSEDGWVKTKERRDYVLGRMLEDKKITKAEHDEAVASEIEPHITPPTNGCAKAGDNAYFCQYVKNIIERNPMFGEEAIDRQGLLRRGGLKIYTTLNPEIQAAAVRSIHETVPVAHDEFYPGAAAINIDNRTGNIYAIAQNTTFDETTNASKAAGEVGIVFASSREYGDSIGFSIGSTYKVYTLLAWLEKGFSLRKGLNGTQRLFNNIQCDGANLPARGSDGSFGGVTNFGGNRGYGGTILDFTRDSLNTGYLAMAEKLGNACDVHRVAERLGANWGWDVPLLDTDPNNSPYGRSGYEAMHGQSPLLGSANIALLDLAPTYAAIANNGVLCEPRAIERIVDPSGNELPIPPVDCQEKIKPDVAAAAAYALVEVMQGSGTGTRANPWDGIPVMGKTGSHESSQTTMVSSTTNTTTAVWVGNFEGRLAYAGVWTHDDDGNADLDKYWGPDGTRLDNARYYIDRSIQEVANRLFGGNAFPTVDSRFLIYDDSDLPKPTPTPTPTRTPTPTPTSTPSDPPADDGDDDNNPGPEPEPEE